MKVRNQIFGVLAIASMGLMSACSGNSSSDNKVRPISDYKNMTSGDSVAYYIGQASALDYWRIAETDTAMQTRESRDQFLKGMRAGLEGVRDNDAYNEGYYMGVQMAMQMKEFSEDFNTSYNKEILINSYTDGLKSDTILDAGKLQQEYTELVNSLNARKEAADKAEAESKLKDEAKKLKLQAINAALYAKAGKGGEGNLLKAGDKIGISITIKDASGKDIDRRDQPEVEVGKMYAGPIAEALLTMKEGETRTFYTYASALLGRYYQRYGLKGKDIISFTIATSKAEAAAKSNDEGGE